MKPTRRDPPPDSGLITLASENDVATTVSRLMECAEAAGLLVFGSVDHSENAVSVGRALRPTHLLVFGHPRGGTPLMEENQVAGIDLPMRALAWEDESGACWLTYNDPYWIAARHTLGIDNADAVDAIAKGMEQLAAVATRA